MYKSIIADGSLKVGVTVSSVANNRANGADVDEINTPTDNDSDTNEPFEDLNFNSNNGSDLADGELPTPTICVYGNRDMAGPFDLDITPTNELPGDSHCECNVILSTLFTLLFTRVVQKSAFTTSQI